MEKKRQLRHMAVQGKPYKTCPFAGKQPVDLSPLRQLEITRNIVELRGQHFCHSADNKKICRGGRYLQLRVLYAIGLLDTPTDEAFNQAMDRALERL